MELKLTDKLAIERTRLANERTFLAYFRSAIVFLSSGFAIIKLEILQDVIWVGYGLVSIGPALFLIGLIRMIYVKKRIKKSYQNNPD